MTESNINKNAVLEVKLKEALRVFRMMEKFQYLFHRDYDTIEKESVQFAKNHYDEINELYRDVIWNWLPEDVTSLLEEEGGSVINYTHLWLEK